MSEMVERVAIDKALADVRTEIGAGYGWGAWLEEEYNMAEHVLLMIRQKLDRSSVSPALDKSIQDELDHPPASIMK
jgi:hypothetical protein